LLKYWLWLTTRKGLGARGARLIAEHFPSPEAAYAADARAYAQIEDFRPVDSLLDKDLSVAEQILRQCYEKGISILTVQDASYPDRLRAMDDRPLVLYYKGMLPDLNGPAIGIVGTRRASVYGLSQARRMGFALSHCGCTVVSGGAKGIDTEALRGALTGGSPVIAVLGCGVDVVYPRENQRLFRSVEQNGCLISEYPPGTPPLSAHFPVRNRIISGLSLGVLVAEAPEKSGALITANRALEQGRDVFVLPANVGVESCSGNLKLLREGAVPVCDAWDILQEYEARYSGILLRKPTGSSVGGELTPDLDEEPAPEAKPTQKIDIDKTKARAYIDLNSVLETLPKDEQALAVLLQDGPMHIDTIADRSQLGAGRALASLTLLELKGVVRRSSAGMYELQTEN